METKKLFYEDAYAREARASVLACDECKGGWAVTLDQTVFYPTGGGQPCDLGTLDSAEVLDVSEKDGQIIHLCSAPLQVGSTVSCKIDWDRRFSLMQQHSGEHLVSGIVHSRFGYDNVGFHMGSDMITIDFSGELTAQQLREVELAANEVIWQDLGSSIFFPDAQRLSELPYRSKKELTGAVRLVKFGEIDLCACCGLHVARTGEIGLIKLFSVTRFHAGSRVELLCGKRALEHLNLLCDQNREVSALLSAKPVATAPAVERIKKELADTAFRMVALENQLFTFKATALENAGNVLLFEDELSSEALRRLADAVLQVCGGRCAVFSGTEGNYKYAIGQKDADLRGFCKTLNSQLCGRGGGKPNFVQGSVTATKAQIEAFFRSEEEQ
ncbi:MAG: alanyl-tRNA editing protein [Oscillospiraceae bacterium]|nr:alanyl-tRNA editing protein [Oscillospiraceae bacterium]